jgi:hypothetical protein
MNDVLDPVNIEREARELFDRPRHPLDFRTAFGTNAIVAVDDIGHVAYGTHSINCPTAFGTGVVVAGAYAGYVLDRRHAREGTPAVPGIYTAELLVRDGHAYCAVASYGASCMVAAWQFANNVAEFGMPAREATLAPRFGIAADDGESGANRGPRRYGIAQRASKIERRVFVGVDDVDRARRTCEWWLWRWPRDYHDGPGPQA